MRDLVLPLTSTLTLGKSLNLSGPQFSHLRDKYKEQMKQYIYKYFIKITTQIYVSWWWWWWCFYSHLMARQNKNVLHGKKTQGQNCQSSYLCINSSWETVIQLAHQPNCLLCVTEDLRIGTRIKAHRICLGIQLLLLLVGRQSQC